MTQLNLKLNQKKKSTLNQGAFEFYTLLIIGQEMTNYFELGPFRLS